MFSRFVPATLVMLVVGGLVVAGTYEGILTKVEDKQITIRTFGKKKDKKREKGEEKVLKINKDTKFVKTVDDKEETVALDDVKKMLTKGKGGKAKAKGKGRGGFVPVKVTTKGEDDKEVVTKVEIRSFKGKIRPKKDAKKPKDD